MDNKISFLAGYILTAATTITAAGVLNAVLLGLMGGFFGLLGKEAYYHTRDYVKGKVPKVKKAVSNAKSKVVTWSAAKVDWVKDQVSGKHRL